MDGFFDAAISGAIHGVTSAQVICPTQGLLKALDIDPKVFAETVNDARLAKASELGPVRESTRRALAFTFDHG